MENSVSIMALPGIPDIKPGDDLVQILCTALEKGGLQLEDGDILVIAHKIVSKAENCIVRMADVEPSAEAQHIASEISKDPRKVEVILGESKRVVRAVSRPQQTEGTLIAEHRLGFICANAAVDESNVGEKGSLILLPGDPDRSAREICNSLQQAFGVRIGVVITDTFGRPWRMGLVNVAVGLAQVPALVDLIGDHDAYGRPLTVTTPALSDELAAASGLLMSKNGKMPALLFRGLDWESKRSSARDLIRPQQEDLFR